MCNTGYEICLKSTLFWTPLVNANVHEMADSDSVLQQFSRNELVDMMVRNVRVSLLLFICVNSNSLKRM